MRLLLTFLTAFITSVLAVEIFEGTIKYDSVSSPFSIESPVVEPFEFNEPDSSLKISFKIKGSQIPQQLFVKIVNEDGVEDSLKPIVKTQNDILAATQDITYSALPKIFKSSKLLKLKLIAASPNEKSPLFAEIASIENADELISKAKFVKSPRFGKLPEIIHIFQTPPKTVNSLIAIAFASLSVASFFGLVVLWSDLGLVNLKNLPNSATPYVFISSIVGYEIIFLKYYLGSSIFQTIFAAFLLLGPALWFGSSSLRYVRTLREIGKR